jgi:hypothetical protein
MIIGTGIDACIEKKLTVSALILIYSGIDTVGWLDSSDDHTTRTSFMKWVDTYLLKAKPLQCTSLDLYSARCGILLTLTPVSSIAKARRICYAWGTAIGQNLQRTIDLTNKSGEYVAVHINDLYEAWRHGVLQFTEELEKDSDRKSRVYNKAGKFFSELSLEDVCKVLTKLDKGPGA